MLLLSGPHVRSVRPGLLPVLAALLWLLGPGSPALAEPYLDKINAIPDHTQTDPSHGGLPGGGKAFCGPVAISNVLMWLADNGFERLAPNSGDRKADQINMIRILGDREYMKTNLKSGTGTKGMVRGVTKYMKERGLSYKRLEYQGWRTHPRSAETGQKRPRPAWLQKGVRGLGGTFLNLGWYTYKAGTDTYYRIGGHWVTLVGYGHDGKKPNDQYLIVHDPGTKDGKKFHNSYVRYKALSSGTLDGKKKGLPRPAAGYYALPGELKIHRKADFAILDGALVLEMPAP